jgi:hypothetical protein
VLFLQLGDAEIEDLRVRDVAFRRAANEDVVRFEVAVDDALAMSRLDPAHRRQEQRDDLFFRQKAATLKKLDERLAIEQLHHHAGETFVLDHIEHDDDVGMVNAPRGQGLAAEARHHLGLVREGTKNDLERDPFVGSDVAPRPNGRHAPDGDELLDAVLSVDEGTGR